MWGSPAGQKWNFLEFFDVYRFVVVPFRCRSGFVFLLSLQPPLNMDKRFSGFVAPPRNKTCPVLLTRHAERDRMDGMTPSGTG